MRQPQYVTVNATIATIKSPRRGQQPALVYDLNGRYAVAQYHRPCQFFCRGRCAGNTPSRPRKLTLRRSRLPSPGLTQSRRQRTSAYVSYVAPVGKTRQAIIRGQAAPASAEVQSVATPIDGAQVARTLTHHLKYLSGSLSIPDKISQQ